MRIIKQDSLGGPEVLEVVNVPTPDPAPGEVRIAVGAIGVNPVDVAVREGWFPLIGEPPFTLGWDVAGTVDAVGEGVTELAVGDRVFGMPRFPGRADGYAEAVTSPADHVIKTPDVLDDVHAAALPLAVITAYRSIVEVAAVQAGQRVLVQAAGGGVGHLAVQIAKALGAHVIATASPGKVDFVRSIGADEVVDYTASDYTEVVDPVDVVIDPFGGESLQRSLSVVRDGGVVVSLLDLDPVAQDEAVRRGIHLERLWITHHRDALSYAADLVAAGRLMPHVAATYPLEQVGKAHARLATGVQGKLVLIP